MRGRKRICASLLVIVLLILSMLPGCNVDGRADPVSDREEVLGGDTPATMESTVMTGKETDGTDAVQEGGELLILTEDYGDKLSPLNFQLKYLIRQFEDAHPGVSVEVEYLPDDIEMREIAVERWRTKILAGKGPDIYLLSTVCRLNKEPLFPDVNQSMRNGLFADISECYDADTALGKDGLLTTVMDAGIVGNMRYVLPLRYNIPVAYVNMDQFSAAGLSTVIFSSGIVSVLDQTVATGNPMVAASAELFSTISKSLMNFFPGIIDYDNEEILLTKEEMVDFLDSYQAARALQGENWGTLRNYPLFLNTYIDQSMPFWANEGYCMALDDLDTALAHAAVAKAEGIELEMFPITTSDGSLIADVAYYGAVGNSCENVELAYAFLREFLSEDSQWENNVYGGDSAVFVKLIAYGWPVRTKGSVSVLYENLYNRISVDSFFVEATAAKEKMNQELTDEDIPVLQAEIDQVRFSLSCECTWSNYINSELCDAITGKPKDTNIEALAEEWVDELYWHLYEG